ncbi:MAG: GNAT family N-acetyltransferase [Polyangiaceae bacterium]
MATTGGSLHADPEARAALDRLYDAVWPGLVERIARARQLGADWYEVSTPFAHFEEGRALAHVGVVPIPLVMEGERVNVAGIHAVATHPDHRRRGLVRGVLERAIAFAEERFATQQLTTFVPEVFTGHGCRRLPQHHTVVAMPKRDRPSLAPVSIDDAPTRERLRALVRQRTPVSHRLGPIDGGHMVFINEVLETGGLERFRYDPELDVAVVVREREGALEVMDLIAREVPPLDEVLARLDTQLERARLCFTPDRFDVVPLAVEPAWPEDSVMARGPYPPEEHGAPFVLPPLAHC